MSTTGILALTRYEPHKINDKTYQAVGNAWYRYASKWLHLIDKWVVILNGYELNFTLPNMTLIHGAYSDVSTLGAKAVIDTDDVFFINAGTMLYSPDLVLDMFNARKEALVIGAASDDKEFLIVGDMPLLALMSARLLVRQMNIHRDINFAAMAVYETVLHHKALKIDVSRCTLLKSGYYILNAPKTGFYYINDISLGWKIITEILSGQIDFNNYEKSKTVRSLMWWYVLCRIGNIEFDFEPITKALGVTNARWEYFARRFVEVHPWLKIPPQNTLKLVPP